jgi:hypothetical protein
MPENKRKYQNIISKQKDYKRIAVFGRCIKY